MTRRCNADFHSHPGNAHPDGDNWVLKPAPSNNPELPWHEPENGTCPPGSTPCRFRGWLKLQLSPYITPDDDEAYKIIHGVSKGERAEWPKWEIDDPDGTIVEKKGIVVGSSQGGIRIDTSPRCSEGETEVKFVHIKMKCAGEVVLEADLEFACEACTDAH